MPVREVVVHRDIRSPVDLSPRLLRKRYFARRAASVAALVAMDCAAIVVSAYVALQAVDRLSEQAFVAPSFVHIAAATAITIFVFLANGLYGRRAQRHDPVRILRAAFIALVVVAVGAVAFGLTMSRGSALVIWTFAVAATLVARTAYDWALSRAYPESDRVPVVLVARPEFAAQAQELLARAQPDDRYRVLGIVSDAPPEAAWCAASELPCLGGLEDLDAILRATEPGEVLVGDPDLTRRFMPELIEICRRRRVVLKLAAVDLDFGQASVCFVPGLGAPVFVVRPPALAGIDFYLKRIGDVVAATLLTVVLSPLLATIAIAIKLDSRGPIFYVDTRIGLAQRPFRCLKFRTMRRDAALLQGSLEALNEAGGAIFKIRDDPRVTRVGRWLRKTSLDELPQLLNVVIGQMSLVGPRPLPLRDFALLEDVHKQRHVVLPGITGLWQVSGRSDLSFDEMIALDFRYIETWSIGSDLLILLRTLGAVFGIRGAY